MNLHRLLQLTLAKWMPIEIYSESQWQKTVSNSLLLLHLRFDWGSADGGKVR